MVSATKDPIKVRAGKIGADIRWGSEPRVVRLDQLTPPQRRLVVALVDAARKEAVTVLETSVTAEPEVRRDSATPTS
ncbi:MAG TPA: hypothetical protein VIM30_07800 [Candidatus Limnocylindrales bacterium]